MSVYHNLGSLEKRFLIECLSLYQFLSVVACFVCDSLS